MKRILTILGVIAVSGLVSACGPVGGASPGGPTTSSAPPSSPMPNLAEPDGVAQSFLDAWMAGNYEAMYGFLSANSQTEYSLEDFTQTYTDAAQVMQMESLEATLLSMLPAATGATAQAAFRVVYHTRIIGPIEKELPMRLVFADGRWGIVWSPALVFPEMAGGNTLRLEVVTPARANIYDRNGLWLVSADATAVTLSIVPGEISQGVEDQMLQMLSEMLRMPVEEIRQNYSAQPPDWRVALGDVDLETFQTYYNRYTSFPGLYASEKTGRRYFNVLAPHVLGYIGYDDDSRVGMAGLEQWGERYLAGVAGGRLTAWTPAGDLFGLIANKDPQPALSLYTTLDRNLQVIVQDAIEEAYRTAEKTWAPTAGGASVVVLDVNTGDVLAMASYPSFDPNVLSNPDHPLSGAIDDWLNNPLKPFLNRPTQGQYPPGSVFKVISTIAALESGIFQTDSSYTCTGVWDELGQESIRYDWLEGGHGPLTLLQGLTASCNPWFYHIGLRTGQLDPSLLANYARMFGMGSDLGIEIAEEPGLVPDPDWLWKTRGLEWALDNSVNLAIGQGDLLVTPLQIAAAVAAIANGGTVYQPHLVDRIGLIGEDPAVVIEPVVLNQVTVRPETLAAVREAMRGVIVDSGIGTAYWRLGSLGISAAGKTGTAQSPMTTAYPHAWFAGFVPYDEPQLAIVVMVENGGQGSSVAAPIFRRIVERYFNLSVLAYPYDWTDPEVFEFVTEEGVGE